MYRFFYIRLSQSCSKINFILKPIVVSLFNLATNVSQDMYGKGPIANTNLQCRILCASFHDLALLCSMSAQGPGCWDPDCPGTHTVAEPLQIPEDRNRSEGSHSQGRMDQHSHSHRTAEPLIETWGLVG